MDWLIILLIVLVAGNLGMVYLLWQRLQNPEEKEQDIQGFVLLQNQMQQLTQAMDSKLLEVVRGVSATQESTKQVFTLADQLKNLEKHVGTHDRQIHTILETIRRLMTPPEKPRREIGFHVKSQLSSVAR